MPAPAGDEAAPHSGGFQGHSRLGNKVALIVGSHGLGSLLGYAALLAIGRFYAPGAYGAYLFAVSVVGVFATLFSLGFTQAHQRALARGLSRSDALGVYVRIRAMLTLAMVAAITFALWVWIGLLGNGFTDATSLDVIIIILASSLIAGGRSVATDTWVAEGRVHRAEWCNAVDSLTYAGIVVLVGLGFGAASGGWIPLHGLGSNIASLLDLPAKPGVLVLGKYIALAHFSGKIAALGLTLVWWLKDGTRIGAWDPKLASDYRAFALPVALTGVIALVLQHTDVLMLGFFWTTREVGWYGAAQRLANVALLANMAIKSVLMPYFASLLGRGEDVRAMNAFRLVERFLLLAVIPLAFAMIIWAREGIHIFVGDGFLGAAPALQWLAAWTLIAAMNMPVRAKHMAAGHTDVLVRAVTLNASLNVVLNLILIPRSIMGVPLLGLGAEGAALATFASSLVAYVYNRHYANARFHIPFIDRAQIRMFAAGAVPLGLWIALRATLAPTAYDRVWELVGIGAVGGLAYFAALWLVKGIGPADIRLLLRTLHLGELGKEVRGRG